MIKGNIRRIIVSALIVLTVVPIHSFCQELPFKDVPDTAWYYNNVKKAYETGLINGMDSNTFAPDSDMTYAQTIKLAACMNQKYTSGLVTLTNGTADWYESYVDYAKSHKIIIRSYDWNAPATRAEYVEIFAKALSDEGLKQRNVVEDGGIPDVDMTHPQATGIYKLYRAGVLTGIDEKGTFEPNSNIKRSEVAAILTRMMDESARKDLTLKQPNSPETPMEQCSLTDSWEQIIASINDGSYKSKYHVGDIKELDLGPEGTVEMQIAAFDADELADGSGNASTTWVSKQTLNSESRMNPPIINPDSLDPSKVLTGTGNVGGWEQTEMRSWLKKEIKPLIPTNVQKAIKPVKKYTTTIDSSGSVINNAVSEEDVWIPSVREVFGNMASYEGPNGVTPYYESIGPIYEGTFNTDKDRIKQKTGTSDDSIWWLRSSSYIGSLASHSFVDVSTEGNGKLMTDFTSPEKKEGVVICFCL